MSTITLTLSAEQEELPPDSLPEIPPSFNPSLILKDSATNVIVTAPSSSCVPFFPFFDFFFFFFFPLPVPVKKLLFSRPCKRKYLDDGNEPGDDDDDDDDVPMFFILYSNWIPALQIVGSKSLQGTDVVVVPEVKAWHPIIESWKDNQQTIRICKCVCVCVCVFGIVRRSSSWTESFE